ncbi:MAG: DNA polymerase III subunit gamma/tau, partial [Burkholderiales bacterium]|nr:DNA polymerase III subunit gamma/tau [Burkholderiales bacterium]
PAKKRPEAPIARDAGAAAPASDKTGSRSAGAAASAAGPAFDGDWPKLANQLKVSGFAKQLAQQSELRGYDDESMELGLAFSAKHLADRTYQDKLRAALQEHFGKAVALKLVIGEISGNTAAVQAQSERQARQGKALEAIQGDAFVRDLMDTFDATIVSDSVKPT